MAPDAKFLLVIPAFREHNRLPGFLDELLPAIRDSGLDIRVRIVDDGSGRREQRLLQEFTQPLKKDYVFLEDPIVNAVHHGKGYCVYTGWRLPPVEAELLAFIDADGSIAPDEMLRLMHRALEIPEPQLLLIASRQSTATTTIRRRFLRNTLNRVFTYAVNSLFGLSVQDSQCGYKIISAGYFRSIEEHLHEQGFCFDVELLALAKADGVPIHEEPITWVHRKTNRIHVLKDGVVMLLALLRLRTRINREIRREL